ncbi:MAG: hypothetical protein Q9172_003420 [Xanthocarpia lactea]
MVGMMRAIFVFTQECEHCIGRLQEGLSARQQQVDTYDTHEEPAQLDESYTHQQHVDTSVPEDPDPPSYSTAMGQTSQTQIKSYPLAMTIANRRILGPRFEAAMLSYAEEAIIIQEIIEGFISHRQLDVQYITPFWGNDKVGSRSDAELETLCTSATWEGRIYDRRPVCDVKMDFNLQTGEEVK